VEPGSLRNANALRSSFGRIPFCKQLRPQPIDGTLYTLLSHGLFDPGHTDISETGPVGVHLQDHHYILLFEICFQADKGEFYVPARSRLRNETNSQLLDSINPDKGKQIYCWMTFFQQWITVPLYTHQLKQTLACICDLDRRQSNYFFAK